MNQAIAPVEVEITVGVGVDAAFETFTGDIASWWPTETHSIGEARVASVVMEPRAGGRFFERWDDGTEHDWGEILEWDPPRRLVCSWRPNPDRSSPTEVEVRFDAAGNETRVTLQHRGWERLGDEGVELRGEYAVGWTPVVERFARRCALVA